MKLKFIFISILIFFLHFSCTMNKDDDLLISPDNIADKTTTDSSTSTPTPTPSPEPVNPPTPADPVNATAPSVSANRMLISPDGSAVTFTCNAESSDGNLSYQWYYSADGTTVNGTVIDGATESTYTTQELTKGIHYYYCTVTNSINDNGDGGTKTSNETLLFSAAYTGLPTVYITTPDEAEITSKEIWMENATISISGAENIEWNFEVVSTSIRGRGNSTWESPKKPYALKLDEKQKILGMPKHKRWVLIANYLDNSFIRNSMAFYLSEKFNMDWTVHGKFINLIMNGKYQGLYWLGEAIKVNEKRVNINDGTKNMNDEEDKDYLIEMDTYYDEPVKFYSGIREMPFMIKNDDYMIDENKAMTTGGNARLARLKRKILALELLLYPNYLDVTNLNDCEAPSTAYTTKLDDASWAKFWLVNEIMTNGELGHPKSCYFTFDSTNNVLKAGPVWDFDWASLSLSNEVCLNGTIYYNALFKSDSFKNAVKTIWAEKSGMINLSEQIEIFRNDLKTAATYDALIWGINHNPNLEELTFSNFDGHVDFLKDALNNKFQIVSSYILGL